LVATLPSAWVIEKPVLVALMHWVALVPQRLLVTLYCPPWMGTLPHWSQIWVSAVAVCAETTAATPNPAASRPTIVKLMRRLFMSVPFSGPSPKDLVA
jgi:hypothetical protein